MVSDDRFGVALDARNARKAWARADELRALGAHCASINVHDFDQLEAALQERPPDVRVIAVLGAEHLGAGVNLADFSGWDATVRELAERFAGRVWALECLSGWDTRGIDPRTVVACTRQAARILHETGSGIVCLLGGVTGPHWMTALRDAAHLLTAADRAQLGGAGFRPWHKNARGFPGFDHCRFEHGEIDIAVQDAHDLVQMPIWVTGFGVPCAQAGGEAGQARYVRNAVDLLGALPRSVLAAATFHSWSELADASCELGALTPGLTREQRSGPGMPTTFRHTWHHDWHIVVEGDGGARPDHGAISPPPLVLLV